MYVALLREGGKCYQKCKLFESCMTLHEMSNFGSYETLTPS